MQKQRNREEAKMWTENTQEENNGSIQINKHLLLITLNVFIGDGSQTKLARDHINFFCQSVKLYWIIIIIITNDLLLLLMMTIIWPSYLIKYTQTQPR